MTLPRFRDDKLRLLTSYYYAAGTRKPLQDRFDELFTPPYPEIFIDSGAFSAYTKGAEITAEEYGKWVLEHKHLSVTYANLDVIRDWRGTVRNQEILEGMGLNPLPVYHGGTPIYLLEEMLERYTYIAVGGLVGTGSRSNELMRNLMLIFRKTDQKVAIHGFGAVDMKMQKAFRWYSADSTTWLNGHRWGKLRLFDRSRAGITDLKVRTAQGWAKHIFTLKQLGIDWKQFAFQKQYAPDREMTTKLALIAYKTLEQYLVDIWGSFDLPEQNGKVGPCGEGTGPKIFLAITPTSMSQYLGGMDVWLRNYVKTGEF